MRCKGMCRCQTSSTISFTSSREPEETVGGRSPAPTEASLKTTTGERWTRSSTGEDASGDTLFKRGLACHRRSTHDDDTGGVPEDEVEVLVGWTLLRRSTMVTTLSMASSKRMSMAPKRSAECGWTLVARTWLEGLTADWGNMVGGKALDGKLGWRDCSDWSMLSRVSARRRASWTLAGSLSRTRRRRLSSRASTNASKAICCTSAWPLASASGYARAARRRLSSARELKDSPGWRRRVRSYGRCCNTSLLIEGKRGRNTRSCSLL